MRKSLGILYLATMIAGILLVKNSWDRLSFVYVGSERSPAALMGLRDFSSLKGASLSDAASNQMIDQIKMEPTEDGYRLELSQFVLRDQNGQKSFACRIGERAGVYDRIEVTLMGYGVAEHGRTPKLIISTDCKSEEMSKTVGPIVLPIPMSDIVKVRPVDQQIDFGDAAMTTAVLESMTSVWPEEWRVQQVRYYNFDQAVNDLTLVPNKKGSTPGAFSLVWPNTLKN